MLLIIIVLGTFVGGNVFGGMFQKENQFEGDKIGVLHKGKVVFGYYGVCLRDIRKLDGKQWHTITTTNIMLLASSFAFPLIAILVGICGEERWIFYLSVQLFFSLIGGFLVVFLGSATGVGKNELGRFLSPAFFLDKLVYMFVTAHVICNDANMLKSIMLIGVAIYMIVSGIPFHFKWTKMLWPIRLRDIMDAWLTEPNVVSGDGPVSPQSEVFQNMFVNELERIDDIGDLRDKEVYIYGTGEYALKLYRLIQKEREIKFKGFIDSFPDKWRREIDGNSIYSPQKISRKQKNEIVLVGSELDSGIVGISVMCKEYQIRNVNLVRLGIY